MKKISLLLVLFGLQFIAKAQCVTPSITVSDFTPFAGEEFTISYDGLSPICSTCEWEVTFPQAGYPITPLSGSAPLNLNDVIGNVTLTTIGQQIITIHVWDNNISCDEEFSITVNVNEGECPIPTFKTTPTGVCSGESFTINIDDVNGSPTSQYTITNVDWSMGDTPNLISTTLGTITHSYSEPGNYFVSAYVTFDNGCEGYTRVVNTQETSFMISVKDGDPEFTVSTNIVGVGINTVNFYYTGLPNPNLQPPCVNPGDCWDYELELNGSIVVSSSGLTQGDLIYTATNLASGNYQAVLTSDLSPSCPNSNTIDFTITDTPCDTCNSFKPSAGEYWMSAWVNVETGQQVKSYNSTNQSNTVNGTGTYSEVYIEFEFLGASQTVQFYPTGEIIDGWQRVVGKFTIPSGTEDFVVHLVADDNYTTYFDDIRIHPFNASMKSYVYDGETFWLISELDDNNYATFYEYDNEGGLIRIKKETARGIVTIQETRSNTKKSN